MFETAVLSDDFFHIPNFPTATVNVSLRSESPVFSTITQNPESPALDHDLLQELSAASSEVISCRNAILKNIY